MHRLLTILEQKRLAPFGFVKVDGQGGCQRKNAERIIHLAYRLLVVLYIIWAYSRRSVLHFFEPIELPYGFLIDSVQTFFIAASISLFIIECWLDRASRTKVFFCIVCMLYLVFLANETSLMGKFEFRYYFLFLCCLLVAYPRNLQPRIVAGTVWKSSAVLILATFSVYHFASLGVAPAYQHSTIRFSWGFVGHYFAGEMPTLTVMIWYYCQSTSLKWYHSVIAALLIWDIAMICDTRTFLWIGLAQIIVTVVYRLPVLPLRWKIIIRKAVFGAGKWLLPSLAVIFIAALPFLVTSAGSPVANAVNNFTTSRFSIMTTYFNTYGYQLLGRNVDQLGLSFDNAYMWYCIFLGIIGLIGICVLFIMTGKWCEARGDFFMSLLISLVAVQCLSECQCLLWPDINIAFFAMGAMLAANTETAKH